jgi:hypothetical protein
LILEISEPLGAGDGLWHLPSQILLGEVSYSIVIGFSARISNMVCQLQQHHTELFVHGRVGMLSAAAYATESLPLGYLN